MDTIQSNMEKGISKILDRLNKRFNRVTQPTKSYDLYDDVISLSIKYISPEILRYGIDERTDIYYYLLKNWINKKPLRDIIRRPIINTLFLLSNETQVNYLKYFKPSRSSALIIPKDNVTINQKELPKNTHPIFLRSGVGGIHIWLLMSDKYILSDLLVKKGFY